MIDPSPAPRRLATPRWLDLRLVLGVVLVLGAVLLGATVISRARSTHRVVTARHDLAAGTVLHADDVQLADVQLPGNGTGVYLDDLHAALGRRLDRPVSRGELVPSAAVRRVRASTTLTVPFAAGAAPHLRAGQRIEVWVSAAGCAGVVLLPDVTVQEVHQDTSGSFDTGSDGQDAVIAVDPASADRVIAALALDQAKIRAGVLVGAPAPTSAVPASPASAPVTASPSGPGGLPADLAACAGPSTPR